MYTNKSYSYTVTYHLQSPATFGHDNPGYIVIFGVTRITTQCRIGGILNAKSLLNALHETF